MSSSIVITYTLKNGTYATDAEYLLTNDNCYIAVLSSDGAAESYTLSFADNIPSGTTSSFVTFNLQYKLGSQAYKSLSESSTVTSGQVYKFSIRLTIKYNSSAEPPNVPFNFTVNSVKTSSGTLSNPQTLSREVNVIADNPGIDDFMGANDPDSPTINYGGTTFNITDPQESAYGNNNAVRISNSSNSEGGIADPNNGRISLAFYLPSNKPCYIALRYNEAPNHQPQKLYMTIKTAFDGTIMDDVLITLSGTGVTYIYKNSYDEYIVTTSRPPSYTSEWLKFSGKMDIDIFAANGTSGNLQPDTKLDVVFKNS